MKAVLTKFTPYKGIGLYIGEHEVAVSQIASTPLGLVEIAKSSEPYEPDQLAAVVSRLVKPLAGSRKRMPAIAVGLCARRVFYSTRPHRADAANTTPQAMLREVLHSPNVCVDEMTVEMSSVQSGKSTLASLVSCRTEYLAGLLKTLEGCGIQPVLTEPSPLALLRAGNRERRARKGTVALRLFLGDQDALAMITCGSTCVLWKVFNLPRGRELPTLCSVIRSCQAMSAHCGIDGTAEVLIIHGRADLRGDLTSEDFSAKIGIPVAWYEGPEFRSTAIAFGSALGCLGQGGTAVDLARSMKPTPSLWKVVPWGEVAVQVALVVCMTLFMLARWRSVEQSVAPAKAELARHAWQRGKSIADLNKEHDYLAQRVDAVRKFLGSRIVWAEYTHDLSDRLPLTASLTSFQGFNEFDDGKSKKGKNSLILRAAAPISTAGSMPKEIDQFLNSLHDSSLLRRDFPLVSVADIKCSESKKKGVPPQALFTVICLAKSVSPPPASSEKAKEDHK